MFGRFLILSFCLSFISCSGPSDKTTIPGIIRINEFKSDFIQSRNIDVFLPPGYDENSEQRFPVLYANDGQMVFDKSLAWNNQSWELDSISNRLLKEKEVDPFIIVAIWNTESRWEEYMPQDVIRHLDTSDYDSKYNSVNSNNYLKFLTQELKPHIDKRFRTLRDRSSTSIMGSSMGGLISWYALLKYPDIFGNALCLSTHWPAVEIKYKHPLPEAIKKYFKENLPEPGSHKIYFDFGTEELDKYYQTHQWAIDEILTEKEWVSRKDFMTLMFKGHGHNETYWRDRVHFGLLYLYKKEAVAM